VLHNRRPVPALLTDKYLRLLLLAAIHQDVEPQTAAGQHGVCLLLLSAFALANKTAQGYITPFENHA
jgi:hypothetical protein